MEAEGLEADADDEEDERDEHENAEADSSVSLVEIERLDVVYHVLSIIRRSTKRRKQ